MAGTLANRSGWLIQVALDPAQDGLVRRNIANGLQLGLDTPVPGIQAGQLALARQALPSGLSAWL